MLLLLRALGARAGIRSLPPALRATPAPARSFRYGGCPAVPPCPGPPRVPRLLFPGAPRCTALALLGATGLLGTPGLLLGIPARCQEAVTPPEAPPPPSHPDPPFDWGLFWTFLRPHLLTLSAAIALALGTALLNAHIPVLLGQLVNVVAQCARGHLGEYLHQVRPPALRLLGAYCLQALLTMGYLALLSRVGERLAGALRGALFEALLRQDIAFFDVARTGHLLSCLTTDIQELKSSFKLTISQGVRSAAQVAGSLLSLSLLSPPLTLLLLLALPALVGAGTLLGTALRGLSRRAQEQVAKATGVADEALGNIRTVRAFAMEDQQARLFDSELGRAGHLSERLGLGIAAFQGLSNLALNGVVLGTLLAGGSLLARGELSPGDLMAFLVAAQSMQRSLANISILLGQVVRGVGAGARVLELLALEPRVALRGGGSVPTHTLRGHLAFRGVYFSYPSRPGFPVLQDFSLELPPGKTVAIVGPSGAGKSTVAALLERFYEPSRGSICLDGHDIALLDPSWLRGHVLGFISQEPVLFGTTILENIRCGSPGASEAAVRVAAERANADGFIQGFPDGYGTIVGERGVALSGGQKQRIAIARALLKDPAVLILDEATSALDSESERVVQEALERAAAGRTVLVIAHRLSTIRHADLIVVLAQGRVAEMGTHEELLRRGGLYAELVRRQNMDRS